MTHTDREKDKALLGPGQWLDPPKPPKREPTLTEQVCNAIRKGRGIAAAANQLDAYTDLLDADLELDDDDTIELLRERLSDEIEERRKLDAALKGVLDKRGP